MKVVRRGEGGRERQRDGESLPKKASKSDSVCGFGGGPVEIIFILKVEVSGLSDHNKHGQPACASALVKMTPRSVDSGRRRRKKKKKKKPWMLFLPFRFSSSTPTPAAADARPSWGICTVSFSQEEGRRVEGGGTGSPERDKVTVQSQSEDKASLQPAALFFCANNWWRATTAETERRRIERFAVVSSLAGETKESPCRSEIEEEIGAGSALSVDADAVISSWERSPRREARGIAGSSECLLTMHGLWWLTSNLCSLMQRCTRFLHRVRLVCATGVCDRNHNVSRHSEVQRAAQIFVSFLYGGFVACKQRYSKLLTKRQLSHPGSPPPSSPSSSGALEKSSTLRHLAAPSLTFKDCRLVLHTPDTEVERMAMVMMDDDDHLKAATEFQNNTDAGVKAQMGEGLNDFLCRLSLSAYFGK
ncbi:uncharacterized protein V6R79_016401 [Siganus canaliculatus]